MRHGRTCKVVGYSCQQFYKLRGASRFMVRLSGTRAWRSYDPSRRSRTAFPNNRRRRPTSS